MKKIISIFPLFILQSMSAFAIWNGTEEPDLNKFKFMVSLQTHRHSTPNLWTHECGGSLIAPQFVLTGAHCVFKNILDPTDPSGTKIIPVQLDPSEAQIVTRSGQTMEIKTITLHPKFYWQTVPVVNVDILINDLALIELATPATNDGTISLPKLNEADKYYKSGNSVYAIGYGLYDVNCDLFHQDPKICIPSYPILRSLTMNILPNEDMKFVDIPNFQASAANPYLDPSIFVGAFSEAQGAANFDSGGPLFIKVGQNKYVLIGTDSEGVNLVPPNYQPEVYTRLDNPQNLDWINSVIHPHIKDK